jgi:anti-sigma28 factor (negative regulator of flagellin synthesis)
MAMDGIKGTGGHGEQSFQRAQAALRNLSLVKPQESGSVSEAGKVSAAESRSEAESNQIDFSRSSVRQEKVMEARKRIADGYYDRADIKDAITRSLLENFGMNE